MICGVWPSVQLLQYKAGTVLLPCGHFVRDRLQGGGAGGALKESKNLLQIVAESEQLDDM